MWIRVSRKTGRRVIYFGLATQRYTNKRKVVIDWNNNFSLRGNINKTAESQMKMGTLIWVSGHIISFMHKTQEIQENRFIVENYRILVKADMDIVEHFDRYADVPPEEYFDIFEEQTDSLGERKNPFRRTKDQENEWEGTL